MSSSHVVLPATNFPILPDHLRPLQHQVAGHVHDKKKAKLGFLECGDGTILKPLQNGRRGESELNLYRDVFDPACVCPTLLQLRQLVPKFLGTYTLPNHPDVTYLNLEDMTTGFIHPCVADIKLGRQTYDPLAGPEKIAREESKYPPAKVLGFQLRGMRVYDEVSESFTTHGKDYLRSFDENTIEEAFIEFFSDRRGLRRDAVQSCLDQLLPIHRWFQDQKQLSFYASSVLVIYEGSNNFIRPTVNSNGSMDDSIKGSSQRNGVSRFHPEIVPLQESAKKGDCRAVVRMIDFAHVFPVDHIDNNNLHGIKTLVSLFEKLIEK